MTEKKTLKNTCSVHAHTSKGRLRSRVRDSNNTYRRQQRTSVQPLDSDLFTHHGHRQQEKSNVADAYQNHRRILAYHRRAENFARRSKCTYDITVRLSAHTRLNVRHDEQSVWATVAIRIIGSDMFKHGTKDTPRKLKSGGRGMTNAGFFIHWIAQISIFRPTMLSTK